jgi:hypothetical protein
VVGDVFCGGSVDVDPWLFEPVYCGKWDDLVGCWFVAVVGCEDCGGREMMDVSVDGRDVIVRLRDDVWQLEEPGTLYMTRAQWLVLRRALNELTVAYLVDEPEDG